MKHERLNLPDLSWPRAGTLLLGLCLVAAGSAFGQETPAHDEYYEICRERGYLPGTTPMRRCIMAQRAADLDPLSALSEYQLAPPDPAEADGAESGLKGEFPGARSAEALLSGTRRKY